MLCCFHSGGIEVVFVGRNLDVVPFTLFIDIVNSSTSRTVLKMDYNVVSDLLLVST